MILNKYKGGNALTHKTIGYLHDRARFEPRWMSSLSKLHLPIMILWGDDDAVAPMSIPHSLAKVVHKDFLTVNTIKNTGHFLMLEQPDSWSKNILDFIMSTKKSSKKRTN